uniref:Nose resistant-to-fluoxetine protein N-terminal domain-containing protein n=1 Tax=Strigamia maritima TaxID=126957 RepID=T1IMT3_STRMM
MTKCDSSTQFNQNMLFLFFITFFLLTNTNSIINAEKNSEIDITKLLKKAEDVFTLWKSPLGQSMVLHHFYSRNISVKCVEDFKAFGTGLINGQKWALEMFDAYGKMASGILEGNLVWPGSYSMCKNVIQGEIYNNTSSVKNTNPFYGQFCWVNIKPNLEIIPQLLLSFNKEAKFGTLKNNNSEAVTFLKINKNVDRIPLFKIAVCLPHSCTSNDLNGILSFVNGTCGKILLSFSAYSNGAKLFNCKSESESLECLNGIRVLAMMSIILLHIYQGYREPGSVTATKTMEDFKYPASRISPTFASGLLLTRSHFKQQEIREGNFSWIIKFYLQRYLRLTPVYTAVLIIFESTLYPYYSNGPLWPQQLNEHCYKEWWAHLLYINNFVSNSNNCLDHSWYLAVDMQFFLISPFVLIFLYRFKFISAVIAGSLILTNWIVTASLATINHLEFTTKKFNFDNPFDFLNGIYVKPYCRIAPFLIGMGCAYLLKKNKCPSIVNKRFVILGWLIAAGLSFSVLFGLYHAEIPQFMTSLYIALAGSTWSIVLVWMIYACCNGFGGLVNNFLSLPFWKPLARLTYSTYLIHRIIIEVQFNSSDQS